MFPLTDERMPTAERTKAEALVLKNIGVIFAVLVCGGEDFAYMVVGFVDLDWLSE